MTDSEKRDYLARIKYTPPAKPKAPIETDEAAVDKLRKMFGMDK